MLGRVLTTTFIIKYSHQAMSAIHLYTAKCRYRVESKSVAVWGTQINVRQPLEALFWQNKEHLGLQISFINVVRLYL